MKHNKIIINSLLLGLLLFTSTVFAGPINPPEPGPGPGPNPIGPIGPGPEFDIISDDDCTGSNGGWFNFFGSAPQSMPCKPINMSSKSQQKNGVKSYFSSPSGLLQINGPLSADKITSFGTITSKNLKGSVSKLLCSNENGELIRCASSGIIPAGNLNETLRYDDVAKDWKANSKLKVTTNQVQIGFDGASVPPGSTTAPTPLIVNGNMVIKGTNYKPVVSTDSRFLRDSGQGIGIWSSTNDITNDLFKTIRLDISGYPNINGNYGNADVGEIWGAAIRCPASHPIAISGGGFCRSVKEPLEGSGINDNYNTHDKSNPLSNRMTISSPVHLKGNYQRCMIAYSGDLAGTGEVPCTTPVDSTSFLDDNSDSRTGNFITQTVDQPVDGDISTSNGWMFACSALQKQDNIKNENRLDARPVVFATCMKAQK